MIHTQKSTLVSTHRFSLSKTVAARPNLRVSTTNIYTGTKLLRICLLKIALNGGGTNTQKWGLFVNAKLHLKNTQTQNTKHNIIDILFFFIVA